MDNKIRWQSQPIIPPKTTKNQSTIKQKKHEHNKSLDFQEILDNKIIEKDSIKFSKHAQQRIKSRKIKINENDLLKINEAVNKAAEKGIKDSLILFDDVAFIVSINNRTIITAVDEKNLKENVYTNIDGAVII